MGKKAVKTTRIRCRCGTVILIDQEDKQRVSSYGWRVESSRNGAISVCTDLWIAGKYKKVTLQRFLIDLNSKKRVVRTRASSYLDFRKFNFTIGSTADRKRVLGKPRGDFTSKYKGVYKIPSGWRAIYYIGGKSRSLGVHKSEIAAAKAYDKAVRKEFGTSAYLNFP